MHAIQLRFKLALLCSIQAKFYGFHDYFKLTSENYTISFENLQLKIGSNFHTWMKDQIGHSLCGRGGPGCKVQYMKFYCIRAGWPISIRIARAGKTLLCLPIPICRGFTVILIMITSNHHVQKCPRPVRNMFPFRSSYNRRFIFFLPLCLMFGRVPLFRFFERVLHSDKFCVSHQQLDTE